MYLKSLLKKIIPAFILKLKKERYLNKQRDMFHSSCKELLILVDSILSENKYEYWINYGTLLGAYRDHKFIEHDYDLDIALSTSNYENIKTLMINHGLKLKVEARFGQWDKPICVEYRFEWKNVFIDFNFYKVNNGVAKTYEFIFPEGTHIKKKTKTEFLVEEIDNPFKGIGTIDFLGKKYPVPINTEEYIIANYGINYKTPIKDFDYHLYANNIKCHDKNELNGHIIVYY